VIPLQVVTLVLVLLGAVSVVAARDVVRLTLANALYGLLLVVLFLVFQSPDVALSALVVSVVALPLVLVVAIAKGRGG